MKKVSENLIYVIALILILICSSVMIARAIPKIVGAYADLEYDAIDEEKINPLYEISMEKYLNYEVDENIGTLFQIDLKTGIEYTDNQEYRPLIATEIFLNLPLIENEYPEDVEIIGNSTKATNGSDKAKDYEYEYDSSTGELKIVARNQKNKKGKIYTEEINGAKDDYTIICNYSSNCYNSDNVQRNLEINGFIQTDIFDNKEDISKQVELKQNYEVSEDISGLIATNIETSDIYDGYIVSNLENGTNYKTEYIENLELNISKITEADKINLDVLTDRINYKNTKVDKNAVMDILGNDGYLRILDENGEEIGKLDKETEVEENGIYEINYENELSQISLEISNPIKTGKIVLQNKREIQKNSSSIEDNKIIVNTEVELLKESNDNEEQEDESDEKTEIQEPIYVFSEEKTIYIKNAETKIEVEANNTVWTNEFENEVEFKAKLFAENSENSLFNNPTIEIVLPKEVENVNIGDIQTIWDNGLEIEEANVIDLEENKEIKIALKGEQKSYVSNSILEGTTVVIPATIFLKNEIESVDSNIEIRYTNNKTEKIDYIESGEKAKYINVGIVAVTNEINNAVNQALGDSIEEEIQTGMNVSLKAIAGDKELKNGDEIFEGQIVKEIVTITNNTNNDIANLNIIVKQENGIFFERKYEEDEISGIEYSKIVLNEDLEELAFSHELLRIGESIKFEYEFEVRENEGEETKGLLEIGYDGAEKQTIQTLVNQINKAKLKLNIAYLNEEEVRVYAGGLLKIKLSGKNIYDQNLENIRLDLIIPDTASIDYIEGDNKNNIEYLGIEDGTAKINVKSLGSGEEFLYIVSIKLEDYKNPKTDIALMCSSLIDDEVYYSNIFKKTVEKTYADIEIRQAGNISGREVRTGDRLTYTTIIKNSDLLEQTIRIYDNVPTASEVTNAYIEQKGERINVKKQVSEDYGYSDYNEVDVSNILLEKNEEIKLVIETTIYDYMTDKDSIENVVNVQTGGQLMQSNPVSYSISRNNKKDNNDEEDDDDNNEYDEEDEDEENQDNTNNDDSDDDSNNTKKANGTISGVVWLDANKNGQKDNDEKGVSGVELKLLNITSGEYLNNNITSSTTGNYRFSNIDDGQYIVILKYDNSAYALTNYKVNDVMDGFNSVFVNQNVDGEEIGLTDVLNVENNNIRNINAGLVERQLFDMQIEKVVTKVTATNASGTTVKDYKDSKLAKLELKAKDMVGTNLVVEYKINITNIGEVPGYVNDVIDYIPEGFEIQKGTNKNWTNKNGEMHNQSLSNVIINPGESKVLTLVLTSTIQQNNMGIVNNKAEILQSSNKAMTTDKNTENNKAEAELIVSIKTGAVVIISSIVAIIGILTTVVIIIERRKKNG